MSAMESSVRGLHSEQPTCRRRDRLRAGFQSLSRTFSSRNRRGAENYQQDGVSHPQTSLAGVETPSADFMSRPGSSLPWPEHGEDIAEEDEEEDNNTHSTLFRRMSRSITGWIDPRLHAPGNRDGIYFQDSPFFSCPSLGSYNSESEPDPQSHSRRLSRTVSNWLDPRLHTPGNRDGICFHSFPPSSSPPGLYSSDSLNERDGPYDLPVPLPLPNLSMHFDGPLSDNEGSEEPIASDLPNRSRPLSVDNGASETRRSRRATWGPVPMTELPLEQIDVTPNLRSATPPPIRRPASQYILPSSNALSGQSISASSPLSSISSLFSRTSSNHTAPSVAPSLGTLSSRDGASVSPVLRAGAARTATRMSASESVDLLDEGSEFDHMRARNLRRMGRLHRASSRVRDGIEAYRASRQGERNTDIHDLQQMIRNFRRLSSRREGSNNEGEAEARDGMAPFTIVGIRRVDSNDDGNEEDYLPPYLRELVNPTGDDTLAGNPRERRSLFRLGRQRRQRRVLSFYDRMEFQSREAGGRLQRSRPRSMYGSGSLRRNGVVEPDSPSTDGDTPRPETYVVYLISGMLPENHPLLSTPSLFTENPSYEDMLLIASLLGPAKPPVASETDVSAAPGLFFVKIEAVVDGKDKLVAISREGDERFSILPVMEDGIERPERCDICLSDYEANDEVRKLVKCGHLFHKDCIGHWLTEGRNSCPLCRGEGVFKKGDSEEPLSTETTV